MITETQTREIVGSTAYGQDGEKLGKVGQLFLDDASGRPDFITVHTGLFGTKESFVPIDQATFDGDRLVVPFTKEQVKGAPNIDLEAGGHLNARDEDELYRYYGRGGGAATPVAGRTDDTTVGRDTSGPETDDAMTRSEEQLEVGTASREAGRARLRKYVTTETESVDVPVTKERAVVETEPVTDQNRDQALDGPAISEEEHEVVLHEEKPVVGKTAEPVERVRLGTEQVTDQETVSEEVRKEHIEAEGDIDDRR